MILALLKRTDDLKHYLNIRQLTYCNGAKKIDDSKKDKDFFKEHISPVGDENAEVISFRSMKSTIVEHICFHFKP
jgi:hypothetical protein